jgi:hypothetical protein
MGHNDSATFPGHTASNVRPDHDVVTAQEETSSRKPGTRDQGPGTRDQRPEASVAAGMSEKRKAAQSLQRRRSRVEMMTRDKAFRLPSSRTNAGTGKRPPSHVRTITRDSVKRGAGLANGRPTPGVGHGLGTSPPKSKWGVLLPIVGGRSVGTEGRRKVPPPRIGTDAWMLFL